MMESSKLAKQKAIDLEAKNFKTNSTEYLSKEFGVKLDDTCQTLFISANQVERTSINEEKLSTQSFKGRVPFWITTQNTICPGISAKVWEQTKSGSHTPTQTIYIPGTTGTGMTTGGDFITVNTPGTSTTVVTGPTSHFDIPTGKFSFLLKWSVDGISYKFKLRDLTKIKSLELATIFKNIEDAAKNARSELEKQKRLADEGKQKAEQETLINNLFIEAGMDRESSFQKLELWGRGGGAGLFDFIAADRDGKGIVVNGNDKWIGRWQGAEVEINNEKLLLKLVDEEYRNKNLQERRMTIFSRGIQLSVLNEWNDRVKILATAPSQTKIT